MAKIKIIGSNVFVTSRVKLEEIGKVRQYSPDTLCLFQGETPVFAVGVGKPSVSDCGISFAETNAEGYAMVRVEEFDVPTKEEVAEKYAGVISKLEQLETQIGETLTKMNAEISALAEKITIE